MPSVVSVVGVVVAVPVLLDGSGSVVAPGCTVALLVIGVPDACEASTVPVRVNCTDCAGVRICPFARVKVTVSPAWNVVAFAVQPLGRVPSVTSFMSAGIVSVTVMGLAVVETESDGPLLVAVRVHVSDPPAFGGVAGPDLTRTRSACGVSGRFAVSVLLPVLVSYVRPVTVAVLVAVPVAEAPIETFAVSTMRSLPSALSEVDVVPTRYGSPVVPVPVIASAVPVVSEGPLKYRAE